MSDSDAETLSIVVEREISHPPEKIWRALTEPHFLEEWFMKMQDDFEPAPGHRFRVTADWGVVHCQVRAAEPNRRLTYSWDTKDLVSTVTWTLTPTEKGTLLRMEQTGFRADQQPYYRGATAAWPRLLAALEEALERMA
ncbi:SRPBCC family protein [Chelativorans intermedius]|uniref:SRPBCC domain-containing protein n=1 Tax=Chelativorans intermedius TaxID=515947 RepID=A0ABV6DAE1_9HYPH|nr:SRPBCC domain-containing protein [Chelativorans intermedius]MCT8998661.1 SRPBCC domain-containing protein [Chelativorans intermedius]